MAKITTTPKHKPGLPPGTLVGHPEAIFGKAIVTLFDYDENTYQEREIEEIKECLPYKDKTTVTWINVDGLHDVDTLEKLGELFNIHALTLEDINHTSQRPKVEDFENYVFIVLTMLQLEPKTNDIIAEHVSMILGANYLISFQELTGGDVFEGVRERIRSGKGKIRKMKEDYLGYCLIDSIVDNYFLVLEKMGDDIEQLEDEILKSFSPDISKRLHQFKRDMIYLRKQIWPLREVVSSLQKLESNVITPHMAIFFKDAYDHSIQLIDTIEIYRDLLAGMQEIYLAGVSNRMNQIMKVLTIITTIFIPLSFVASIYGMNFKYMPELDWIWSYPILVLVMLVIAAWMIIMFKLKKWI